MNDQMLAELRGILRRFDRDNIVANHFARPMGTGVKVFITYKQAKRIRQLVKEQGQKERTE